MSLPFNHLLNLLRSCLCIPIMSVFQFLTLLLGAHIAWGLGGAASEKSRALRACLAMRGVDDSALVEYSEIDADYATLNYQWNILHPVKTPLAYLVATRTYDVQAGVRCAKTLGIRATPKGGGHSYEAYSFGDSEIDTLIVDVQRLTEFAVAPDRRSFTVGAGALLGHIAYPLLAHHDLVTPHGTCPTVGIVGLALGGGYGYLSKLYGLTTDNLMAVELVTADGEVHNVNEQTNPDLLWALRGAGSGSFGIVTSLTLRSHAPPRLIIGGTKIYDLDQFPAVFMPWQQFVEETYEARDVNTKLSIKNGEVTIEVFDIQLDDTDYDPTRMQTMLNKFPNTASTNTTSVLESIYADFLFRTSHPGDIGITDPADLPYVNRTMFSQRSFHAKSFFVTRLLTWDEIWSLYFLIEETVNGIADIIIEMYAFGGAISDPPSPTSFHHRSENLYLVQAFYNGRSTYEPSLNWLRKFYRETKTFLGHTASYQNYADGELDDYLARYYGQNLDRLTQIKRTVDPTDFFRHPQSIPLTLSN